MFVAQKKRKENIAEYILYMWQIEDLIRANGVDPQKVVDNVVTGYPLTEAGQRQILVEWYENLTEMMRLEQKSEKGHLQITLQLMNNLYQFHLALLSRTHEIRYHNAYHMAYSDLRAFASRLPGAEEMHDVELGLTALYTSFLFRMKGNKLGSDTDKALQRIGKYLGLLSALYLQEEQKG